MSSDIEEAAGVGRGGGGDLFEGEGEGGGDRRSYGREVGRLVAPSTEGDRREIWGIGLQKYAVETN